MSKTMKRTLAGLLVWLQIFTLIPAYAVKASVVEPDEPETPALNKTIVGTVNFQSFNFLGDNATGEDGTDYSTTFYYTDDYFSPSAINDAASSKTMLWSDLEDPSLAACSFDFAVASYTSAEGDVISKNSQTWNNTDYDGSKGKADPVYGKAVNAVNFLTDCGFANIEPHGLTERPTNDSIGYTIGSKEITVWNADTQKNETYTLIAVGCRGAGYGAEWASNITIGDPATSALPSNGRHYGFDHSAQLVCQGIQEYLSAHSITGNVKYWVTGFSRAAAVANLVAGYLTDNGSTYKTQQRDVFGYTWECPQAASTRENALNYKNIHNIINPMDAVPKVSPDAFEHQRLGVDYQMPYHGNVTSTSQNTTLYTQMYNVLKTIAVGNGSETDPLVDDPNSNGTDDGYVSPSKYPYNSKMTIYKMSGRQLIQDAISGTDTLMSNFGTVVASGNLDNSNKLLGRTDGGWYIDQFIDNLIDVFLTSNAWIGGVGNTRTALQNRATFISQYQSNFRTLMGYFLDFSGPAFMNMVDKLTDAITAQFKVSNAGFGLAFLNFYNDPTGSYTGISNYVYRLTSWWGKTKKDVLISEAKSVAVDTANSLTNGFNDPQGITQRQMNAAMENMVGLVINLYAYELDAYESQYLGTTLRYLNTILCTHEQETVMSWIMSLDPNHMNRSARTITIPAGCDATLYEYRPEYEGDPDNAYKPTAPVVAEVKDGALVAETLKDERIYCTTDGGNLIIRYPASLQIRADVTSDSAFSAGAVSVADYRTTNAYVNVSNGKSQYETTTLNSSTGYSTVTSTTATNVTATNNALNRYGALAAGDTLHILVDDIQTYNENKATTYTLFVDKAPTAVVTDFAPISMPAVGSSTTFGGVTQEQSELTGLSIRTRQTVNTVPSANVYYDDDITADIVTNGSGNNSAVQANANEPELGKGQYSFTFTGTGIDVYCTTYDKITVDGKEVPAGYVQAKLDNDPQQIVTMRTQSDETRYNVPVISFTGLENRQHTLTLNILGSSHFKFDGVRIYNSVKDQTLYEGTNEQYAAFVNLHDALINNGKVTGEPVTVGALSEEQIGALFVGDASKLALTETRVLKDGSTVEVKLYNDVYEAYEKNSPKNEIYLDKNDAITFQLSPEAAVGTLWIGLSAPNANGSQTGTAELKPGKTINVTSAVDMYYRITSDMIGDGNTLTIKNAGDTMLSLTNLKITGVPDIYNAAQASADSSAGVTALNEAVFAPLTMQAIRAAANGGVDPEAVPAPDPEPQETEKPGWNDDANAVPSLLKTLFALLKQSLNDLFGGLGGW